MPFMSAWDRIAAHGRCRVLGRRRPGASHAGRACGCCWRRLLGGLLGLQREQHGKEAGVRTHMLVALGSALFVLVPLQAGIDADGPEPRHPGRGGRRGLPLRRHHPEGTGTGEDQVRGLTTAAGIWLTAAIGIAVGLGTRDDRGCSARCWRSAILALEGPIRRAARQEAARATADRRGAHQFRRFFASIAARPPVASAHLTQETRMLKLYIGNKNYSSWSMRPWVLLKQAGIPFEEVMVRFDSFDARLGLQADHAVRSTPWAGCRCWWTTASRSGTRWPSPNTWPRNFPTSSCGPRTPRRAPAPAASAPRCIPASARCAATAR